MSLSENGTADPTWGDIFECCFKAQSSKLESLYLLKRGKRDVRASSFELSKMSPQVGLAVQIQKQVCKQVETPHERGLLIVGSIHQKSIKNQFLYTAVYLPAGRGQEELCARGRASLQCWNFECNCCVPICAVCEMHSVVFNKIDSSYMVSIRPFVALCPHFNLASSSPLYRNFLKRASFSNKFSRNLPLQNLC